MKIFITGASGFVGGAATQLLKKEHQVVAMARSESSEAKVKALGAIPVRCALGEVELEHLESCDVVIHSAAFVEQWGTREQFWKANVEGTSQLLEVSKKAGVKRFILIGTESALFHGQHMRDIDETYPYVSKTPFLYSETKAEAEKLVLKANDSEKDFFTLSIRPRMIWGPGDLTILPEVKSMVESGQFVWLNKGMAQTSTTNIENLTHAIELALTKGKGGEPYFVTDGPPCSVKEFITKLMATQNVTMPEKSIPGGVARSLAFLIEGVWKIFRIRKEPPLTRLAACLMSRDCTIKMDKAEADLGYTPVVSLDEGMKRLKENSNS